MGGLPCNCGGVPLVANFALARHTARLYFYKHIFAVLSHMYRLAHFCSAAERARKPAGAGRLQRVQGKRKSTQLVCCCQLKLSCRHPHEKQGAGRQNILQTNHAHGYFGIQSRVSS